MEYILPKKDKSVYIEIASRKGAGVSSLSRATGIHRPQIYKIIQSLTGKNLVSKYKNGQRYFYRVTEQANLESVIEQGLETARAEARKLIEESFSKPNVTVIKNKQDIIKMYENLVETLEPQQIYYSLVTTSFPRSKMEEYLPPNFRRMRESKNLWSYLITPKPYPGKPRFSLEVKRIDSGEVETNCMWITYGTKFVFIDFSTESGYIIDDEKLSKFNQKILRKVFDSI